MLNRTIASRYRIIERVGIGGMAEVYKAQDEVLGRVDAVKVLLPQFASDPTFAARFRQEAQAAANLNSPYIVGIYDWGLDGDTYYLVMEYIRGVDLKTAITQRGAIGQRKVAQIASQICSGLAVAHNNDVIHRDIKPQNIMVQPDGNLKVMDFGIARAKNSMSAHTSSVLGTAHYISPEQAQGKELTAASDIYSLGVVMYEAISGQLPFDGPDAVSVAMKQVSEQPRPLHEVFPAVDPVLEAIVTRAMEKDPARRFSTAVEMRRVLNDYLSGRARGTAAAAAILAGAAGAVGVGAGVAAANGMGNETTRRMNPNADAQTQMIGGGIPSSQTQVMPSVGQAGGQGDGRNDAYASSGQGARTFRNEQPEQKSHKGRNILIVLLVLALLAGGAYFLSTSGFFAKTGTVPDVAGKTVDEATAELTSAGYAIGKTTEVYSDEVESGNVISTDPAAGTEAEEGTRIALSVSKGVEKVEVPDVDGYSEEAAKQAITDAGFTAKAGDSEYSDDVDEGKVIKTDPAGGSKAEKGSEVTYVLSKGSEKVAVPWVAGSSEETATKTLEDAGFKVSVSEEYSSDVDEGLVIWQDPDGDTEKAKGSTVKIHVSLGSKKVDVPDVVGYTVSDAVAILENAGFKVTKTRDYSGDAIVTNQSTTGEAEDGATINITAEEQDDDTGTTTSSKKNSGTSHNDDD